MPRVGAAARLDRSSYICTKSAGRTWKPRSVSSWAALRPARPPRGYLLSVAFRHFMLWAQFSGTSVVASPGGNTGDATLVRRHGYFVWTGPEDGRSVEAVRRLNLQRPFSRTRVSS